MRAQLLTSAVALVATVGSAHAADIYTAPPATAVPTTYAAPAPLWTGGYAGAFAGYGWGDVDFTDTGLAQLCVDECPSTFEGDVDGWMGGLFIGYNWQMPNNFVLGLEADVALADMDGLTEDVADDDEDPLDALSAHIDALSTLRGRIGYAFGNFLLFGTGGLAVAHLDYIAGDREFEDGSIINWDDDGHVDLDEWDWGWTIGGGAEFAISDRWSVRGDYLFVDLGDEAGVIHDEGETGDFDTSFHTVRLGIAAHF